MLFVSPFSFVGKITHASMKSDLSHCRERLKIADINNRQPKYKNACKLFEAIIIDVVWLISQYIVCVS